MRKIPTLREHFFDRVTKFAWRVSRWQPTGAWRVLCLRSVGYEEFRKRPKNWATATPWVKSDQKWHFCWNLHEFQDVRSSFFFEYVIANHTWRKNRQNPYLTRRPWAPNLLPYASIFQRFLKKNWSKSLPYAAISGPQITTLHESFSLQSSICRATH